MRIFGTKPFPSQTGILESLTPLVRRMVASNDGVFTCTGTCSYVIGHGNVAVVDPGPGDPEHISRLMQALRGERITHIVATHTHSDHSPGTRLLQASCDAPILGFAGPIFGQDHRVDHPLIDDDSGIDESFVPDTPIGHGDRISGSDWELEVLETPGHTANHLCFGLAKERILLTGDHIMEWAPSVIYPPEGDMGAYRLSLKRLHRLSFQRLFPGHGGLIDDASSFIIALLGHRRNRERRIVERVLAGDWSVEAIMQHLYQDIVPQLRGAATATVFAHLLDMARRELLTIKGRNAKACVIQALSPHLEEGSDVWSL